MSYYSRAVGETYNITLKDFPLILGGNIISNLRIITKFYCNIPTLAMSVGTKFWMQEKWVKITFSELGSRSLKCFVRSFPHLNYL